MKSKRIKKIIYYPIYAGYKVSGFCYRNCWVFAFLIITAFILAMIACYAMINDPLSVEVYRISMLRVFGILSVSVFYISIAGFYDYYHERDFLDLTWKSLQNKKEES